MNKLLFCTISSSAVETALNNFSEADFDLTTISIVMKDEKKARAISDDAGPLKGVTFATLSATLKALKIPTKDIVTYLMQVGKNSVLFAISVPQASLQAARDMIADYKPKYVTVI